MSSDQQAHGLDKDRLSWILTQMVRIREFEERVKQTFEEHPGAIRGHRYSNSVEQITQGETVPIGKEFASRERRRGLTAPQCAAVAGGAIVRIKRLAAFSLLRGVHAVPH